MKKIFTACLIYLSIHCIGQIPLHQWTKTFGSIGEEYGCSIVTDDSSNSYVTGYIDATNFLRSQNNTCINHDIFVAKYDKHGNQIWIKQIGGKADDMGWGITIDSDHNVYIAASFMDTINLDTDTLISNGYIDALICKFNTSGELQWAKKAGGTWIDYAYSIACDSQNNIYVTGSISGTSVFNSTSLISNGSNDYFLAKYDTSGNLLWALNNGGVTAIGDEGYAVSVDNNDNIYICGKFSDTAYFTTDTLISQGNGDIFIAKYNSSGDMEWIKAAGGNDKDVAQSIVQDDDGNTYVTGYFKGITNFDSISLSSSGESDIFLAKYDLSGNLKWVKKSGGTGYDQGISIDVFKNENIYVTGFFNDNASFESYNITSNGLTDVFLLCLDSMGNFNWVKHSGSTGIDAGTSVRTDTLNNIFLTGEFSSSCFFDSTSLINEGSKDFFVTLISANTSVGMDEKKNNKTLFIYPNPTNQKVNILLSDNADFLTAKAEIYSLTGELIMIEELKNYLNILDLINLSKGIYLIKITTQTEIFSNKLIIN
jgi:hypothetical protein